MEQFLVRSLSPAILGPLTSSSGPVGTEPQNIYAVNLFALPETPPETQKVYAVNLFAVVEAA